MKKFILLPLAGAVLAAGAHAGAEQRRRDQDAIYSDTRRGEVRPLREIEARVVPKMGGASYIGPEYDSDTARYRLKFMRGGSVIWVDVDGRTGAVLGRSGN
ncbi:hypothetical protein [Sphingomonas profundi]|uniref:hypothetical protein n=1 Tax=Alterirhizorhabdus profundi TaxID=2681549 RepID=UPI001E3E391E|nr:hypothetical protein [Sphingomonas profundi]